MKQFRYLSDVLKVAGRGSAKQKKKSKSIVLQIFIGLVTYDEKKLVVCGL